MGFLSKLFGKKETLPPEPKAQPSDNGKEGGVQYPGFFSRAATFSKAFRKHMAAVGGFSPAEVEAMLAFLAAFPPDIPKKPRCDALYDKFVKPKAWSWPAMEERMEGNPKWDPIRQAYKKVKVADKKAVLSKLGIDFDKKAKSDELLEVMVRNIPEDVVDSSCPELRPYIEDARDNNKYYSFYRFIYHIDSYAHNLEHLAKLVEMGASYKLHVEDAESMAKVLAVLAKHPDEIPPFFPEDWTMMRIDLDADRKTVAPGTRTGIELVEK